MRRIYVDLPAGVIGNPNAVPECSADLIRYVAAKCPPSSQVGIATVVLTNSITLGDFLTLYVSVYRMELRRGYAAEFLISGVLGMTNVPILASARTDGDFGVRTAVIEVPAGRPLHASLVTFWGVPWSSANDKWRPPAGVAYIPADGLPNEYGEQPVSYDPSGAPSWIGKERLDRQGDIAPDTGLEYETAKNGGLPPVTRECP